MTKQRHISCISFSGIGKRANNEDAYYTAINPDGHTAVCMVCDGVGGQNKGEVASALVCTSFKDFLVSNPDLSAVNWVQDAIKHTEQKFDIATEQDDRVKGMASTLTLVAFRENDILIAHCGDSRVYHFRNQNILFRTKDHSYTNWLIDRGELTQKEALTHPKKNVITRCIAGTRNPTKADIHITGDIQMGDFILLCTDGVLEACDDATMANLMRQDNDINNISAELQKRCEAYSDDNYTATLIKILPA